MTKILKRIEDLMLSDAYTNSSNPKHNEVVEEVNSYFKENFKDGPNTKKKYKWLCGPKDNCGYCASLNGKIMDNKEDFEIQPPIHPNCKCEIIEVEVEDIENRDRVDIFIDRLLEPGNEGVGYSIVDQPTNSGITQGALTSYSNRNDVSKNLKKLSVDIARDIYKKDYYYDKKIDKIKNDRIAYAIFDIGVMTSPDNVALVVQNSLNEYGLSVEVDKIIGKDTIASLNKVDNVEKFMDILIKNRIDFLNGLPEKDKWKGWFPRTRRY